MPPVYFAVIFTILALAKQTTGKFPNIFEIFKIKSRQPQIREKTLLEAVKDGESKIVRVLLSHGHDTANGTGKDRVTPLHVAVRNGDVKIMKMLFQYGANINAQTKDSKTTPVHEAFAIKDPSIRKKVMEEIIGSKKNLNFDLRDRAGVSVRSLLEAGGYFKSSP